jgi:hypothetical protein
MTEYMRLAAAVSAYAGVSTWQRMRVMIDTSSGLSDSLVRGAGVQGRAVTR